MLDPAASPMSQNFVSVRDQRGDIIMRAIVIGGSLAGLMCARVLSEFYDEVVVLDKDTPEDHDEPRKGASQGRHVHALLAAGTSVMGELFPGLYDDMAASGARKIDAGRDVAWFYRGAWRLQAPTGVIGNVQTRPLLEMHVRRRVAKLRNVRQRFGVSVNGLTFDTSRQSVTGVQVVTLSGDAHSMSADLVVDCSGRGSKTPAWLEHAGYASPKMTSVAVDLGYATQLFRSARSAERDWMLLLVQATPPNGSRDGAAFQIAEDVLQITLAGHFKDYPPDDPERFLAFAEGLEHRAFADVIRASPPLSPIVTHRFASSLWRHYERLSRFPNGFLVMGDAMSSLSPLYGQGMSVAALEALALRETLRETGIADPGKARLFFKRAAKVVKAAWTLATGADLAFPKTQGARPPAFDLSLWYVDQVTSLCCSDADILRTWLQVAHLQRPVTDLFRPRILARVLRTALAGGPALVAGSSNPGAPHGAPAE